MPRIINFRDNDGRFPIDFTGFNKVGLVSSDNYVTYFYKRGIDKKARVYNPTPP